MSRRANLGEALRLARDVLAVNLRQRLTTKYPLAGDVAKAFENDFKATHDISRSSVARLMNPSSDGYSYPRYDKLVAIAHALRCQPYELFLTAADVTPAGKVEGGLQARDLKSS